MDITLKQLCVDLDLTSIGVNVFGAPAKPYICVYVHWDGTDNTCASGSGDTFDEALAAALSDMATRQKQDADNAAEAAYLDHQKSLVESGGPDDSAYCRDMIAAGRGHLLANQSEGTSHE